MCVKYISYISLGNECNIIIIRNVMKIIQNNFNLNLKKKRN